MIWILQCPVTNVHFVCIATQLKTEMGSLPEGKVKVRLEHDGTLLEVDEDDVEKVGGVTNHPCKTQATRLNTLIYRFIYRSICLSSGESSFLWSSGGSLISSVPQWVQHPSHIASALWWNPHSQLCWVKSAGDQSSQHPCHVLREGTNFTKSYSHLRVMFKRDGVTWSLFLSGDADV